MCVLFCVCMNACVCVYAHACVCMHAHICMGWREGLREGYLLSYSVFFHILMTLSKSTGSTKTFSYSISQNKASGTALKFPPTVIFPHCLLISKHAQMILKMVGSEHHPISPSFGEGSGRISFKSSLFSTSSRGHAS